VSGEARILMVSGSGGSNTLRYRVRMAEEALRSRGFATSARHFTDPQLLSWLRGADVLWLYRTPASRRVLRLVETARERRIPVTFDVDDLVFRPEHLESIPFLDTLPPAQRRLFEADVVRRGNAVRFVDRASGTTRPVVEDLRRLTSAPVDVLPNGVSRRGAVLAAAAARRSPDGTVRLGYFSGSATHDEDWASIEPAVVDLMRCEPSVALWLVGPLTPGPALARVAHRVQVVPAVPWTELPALLAQVDINLAPLDATAFTSGKSAIKWLEAALVRTPTVATATPPFVDAVDDGRTGLLVAAGGDWRPALSRLVTDVALRAELGDQARVAALDEFGPDRQADRYQDYVGRLVSGPTVDVDLTLLVELARREPASRSVGLDLEPFRFDPEVASLTLEPPWGARSLGRVRTAGRVAVRRGNRLVRGGVRRLRGAGDAAPSG